LYARDGTKLDLTSGTFNFQVRDSIKSTKTPLAVGTVTIVDQADNKVVLGLSSYKTSLLKSTGTITRTVVGELDFVPTSDAKNPRTVGLGSLLVSQGGNATTYDETAPDPTTAVNWTTLTVSGTSSVATALVETAGPTTLPMKSVARGQLLRRTPSGPDGIEGTDAPAAMIYGTTDPPDPTDLPDGTVYLKYTP
jgi:hypothetical protein